MNTKTMEGLVGARTNINIANTPLRVYKEARSKGDTATMERAMGYVNEYEDRADQYKSEADEGMKEDAKESREMAKLEREKAIEKRREECQKLQESKETAEDKVDISEDGKALLQQNTNPDADSAREPITYTKTGEVIQTEQSASISVSV